MQFHVWGWFMIFVIVVFALLWLFQIIFLQKGYDSMKQADIRRVAADMADKVKDNLYQTGQYQADFIDLCVENNMCAIVVNSRGTAVFFPEMLGSNCLIHSRQEYRNWIVQHVRESPDGIYSGTETKLHTKTTMFVFGCVIGSQENPQGYLLINSPMEPVNSSAPNSPPPQV